MMGIKLHGMGLSFNGKRYAALIVAAVVVSVFSATQAAVTPRFEGLRSDSTYMALLERGEALELREAEMLSDVEKRRSSLSQGDAASQRELKQLEFDLFDLQRERREVVDQVRGIEQRWELQGIEISETVVDDGSSRRSGIKIEGESVRSVAASRVVKEMLSTDDYDLLQSAQSQESVAADLHGEFMSNYQRMRELQQLYAQTDSEEDAEGYMVEFEAVIPVADSLLMELDDVWSLLYDDKVFLFSLILEVLDREDVLLRGEEILREWRSKIPSSSEEDVVVAMEYDIQKRALLQYEMLIGEVLKLDRAVSSLRSQYVSMGGGDDIEVLHDVAIRERNFIDYEDIKFSTTPKYQPGQIPEAKLYEKGTIYRIQMGAYKSSQLPSVFRGAYPLSFDKALGFWTYYTGAYSTMIEAQGAVALCKKQGFNRPEIVVWRDGVRRNLSREPLPATKGYRVIVETVSDITEGVESLIAKMCGDVEITRIGDNRYIVGDMNHLYLAEELEEELSFEQDVVSSSMVEIE